MYNFSEKMKQNPWHQIISCFTFRNTEDFKNLALMCIINVSSTYSKTTWGKPVLFLCLFTTGLTGEFLSPTLDRGMTFHYAFQYFVYN